MRHTNLIGFEACLLRNHFFPNGKSRTMGMVLTVRLTFRKSIYNVAIPQQTHLLPANPRQYGAYTPQNCSLHSTLPISLKGSKI